MQMVPETKGSMEGVAPHSLFMLLPRKCFNFVTIQFQAE